MAGVWFLSIFLMCGFRLPCGLRPSCAWVGYAQFALDSLGSFLYCCVGLFYWAGFVVIFFILLFLVCVFNIFMFSHFVLNLRFILYFSLI